jgi:hypothetical protein
MTVRPFQPFKFDVERYEKGVEPVRLCAGEYVEEKWGTCPLVSFSLSFYDRGVFWTGNKIGRLLWNTQTFHFVFFLVLIKVVFCANLSSPLLNLTLVHDISGGHILQIKLCNHSPLLQVIFTVLFTDPSRPFPLSIDESQHLFTCWLGILGSMEVFHRESTGAFF